MMIRRMIGGVFAVFLCFLVLASVASRQAYGQYKHIGLGANLGLPYTFGAKGNPDAEGRAKQGYGVGAGFTLGLEGSWRFEDRWAVAAEAHFSFHACEAPNDICRSGSTPIMFTAVTELRFYFVTNEFRPYLSLGIAYWQSVGFIDTNISAFGPEASLGFDWFFMEELSLGVRVRYGLQLFVGEKGLVPYNQIMALATFSAFF